MSVSHVLAILTETPQSSSRDLILDALPYITKTQQEPLHPFQTEVLAMANELLDAVRSLAVENETTCVTHAADAAKMLAENSSALHALEAQQTAAGVVRDGFSASALQAEEAHAKAEYEQSRSEANKALIANERNTLEQEQANSAKFMDDGWEGMDVHIVTAHLLSIGAEPALVAAVPQMLAVQVDQRGPFDNLTCRALTFSLKERADIVESLLKEIAKREKEAASFALGAWAYADVAGVRAASAAEQVANTEESLQSLKTELAQCKKHVSAQEKAVRSALVQEALAEEKVRQIDQAAKELRSLTEQDVVMQDIVMQPTLEIGALAKATDLPSTVLASPVSSNVGGC